MKKIFTSLLALTGFGLMTASAQRDVDLAPQVFGAPRQGFFDGKHISPTGLINSQPIPTDSASGVLVLGIGEGGGTLLGTDTFLFFGPWRPMNDDGTMGFNVGFPNNEEDVEGSVGSFASIFYLGGDNITSIDSINTLLNIDSFTVGLPFETLLSRRSELVVGNVYGWYTHMRPYPNWLDAVYSDPDQSNNWSYIPVIWQSNTTSVAEMFANSYTPVDVFPNPTTSNVSMKVNIVDGNKFTVLRIIDQTGREISSKRLGATSGEQTFTSDVANLPAGMYNMQLICEKAIYVGKFVKN